MHSHGAVENMLHIAVMLQGVDMVGLKGFIYAGIASMLRGIRASEKQNVRHRSLISV